MRHNAFFGARKILELSIHHLLAQSGTRAELSLRVSFSATNCSGGLFFYPAEIFFLWRGIRFYFLFPLRVLFVLDLIEKSPRKKVFLLPVRIRTFICPTGNRVFLFMAMFLSSIVQNGFNSF